MKLKINKSQGNINNKINFILRDMDKVPNKALNYFINRTPRDSGNARSKTKLKQDVILANYPYAERLDKGYSRQAPKGMAKPTIDYIRKIIKNILGK